MNFLEYEKIERAKPGEFGWAFDFDFEVSQLVVEARLKLGLTQKELARRIGTQQPSIARVESGALTPSLGFLKKLAAAMDTTLIPPMFGFMKQPTSTFRTTCTMSRKISYSTPIRTSSGYSGTNHAVSAYA